MSPDRGILELVKNAYDADAARCVVELDHVTRPGGTVRVRDTGDGMTRVQIEDGWMVLGASEKAALGTTRKGRVPAGNKGLGRLAALRMGRKAVLKTRPRRKNERGTEYRVELPWNEFDSAKLVKDVSVALDAYPTSEKPGTLIEVQQMRSQLGRNDVKRLARGLILLSDPFDGSTNGFDIKLVSPEFPDLEKRVETGYLSEAEFHLVATVDDQGRASAIATDYKGNVLYQGEHEDIRRSSSSPYDLPKAQFDLWVFVLDRKTFATRPTSIKEVKEWLQSFGGVYLYAGDIRISPYGDPGDDWLGMNLLRAARPYLRPSTRTAIGRVRLESLEGELRQKTDREGLVENEAFGMLKEFGADSLEWLARMRLHEREAQRAREKEAAKSAAEKKAASVEEAIESLPADGQLAVRSAFYNFRDATDRERAALEREVQLYRTLSTIGIVAATFAHESRQPIDVILRSARTVRTRTRKLLNGSYEKYIAKPLERIITQGGVLGSFGGVALRLSRQSGRRAQRVELHPLIRDLASTLAPLLDERSTTLSLDLLAGQPYLRASPAAFESVLTNLIVNSLRALEGRRGRKIIVRTEALDTPRPSIQISVLDSGPGISGINTRDIWLPGETTADEGTGYGLTIVRDTVRELGGDVDVSPQGDLGGATFTIDIPVLGY